eukprot:15414900-Heterocapsa_arctica.AAC.1
MSCVKLTLRDILVPDNLTTQTASQATFLRESPFFKKGHVDPDAHIYDLLGADSSDVTAFISRD